MPVDRFLHPRLGRDERVTQLSDLEARVWSQGVLLCADDYGVMRCSPLPIQELNDALARQPARVIERCLARLVTLGLLLRFEFQGRSYLCFPDWQDEQKVKYPRPTLNPLPPAEILARCSEPTRALFRKGVEKRMRPTLNVSGNVPETLPEVFSKVAETLQSPAGAHHVANGYRQEASGKRLPARRDADDGLRGRFDAFWQQYPKKVGKDDAWRAWQKRAPGADLDREIHSALAWQRGQDTWLHEGGRFIPNPATWIARGQWQDEQSQAPHLNARTISIARAGEEFVKS